MLDRRDELNFEKVWAKKQETGKVSNVYIPGENQRIDFCIQHVSPGLRFLDIGCGTGVLAVKMKERFSEVHGIDIADFPVQIAMQNGVKAIQLNLNSKPLPYPNDFFETVTILSTIQYFYDLEYILTEINRVIRVGGQFILTVPNMRTYWRLLKLALKGEFPKTSKDLVGYDGGALHYFCYSDIASLLEDRQF